jgi:4-amino-4-deoxychorismate mutase
VSAQGSEPAESQEPTSGLEPFRRRLDALDEQVTRLLGERFDVCREIARYKQRHAIPMMQPGRVQEVRARYRARGAQVGLPRDFTAALFELLIGATCKLEDQLMGNGSGSAPAGAEQGIHASVTHEPAACAPGMQEPLTQEPSAQERGR